MAANQPISDSTKVQLSLLTSAGFTFVNDLTNESAEKASELLTQNHVAFHTRWKGTFHNHITHHLLALWSLGARPSEIQAMWDLNTPYQSLMEKQQTSEKCLDMKDPATFQQCLGQNKCYDDFLHFFESQLAEKDISQVVREYVLNGDERANDIFGRLYTDLVHPMIHLGCGIEYNQPSLVAEALAAACVHVNWPKHFLLATEAHVQASKIPSKPLLRILEDIREDPEIVAGANNPDVFNKIPDGFLKRVTTEQLVPYLSQFQVQPDPEQLRHKLAEMMYTCAYIMGAAQRPRKREAIDFVLLHCATLSVFYPAIILGCPWMSNLDKARFLEAKVRMDIVMYAGCMSPAMYPDRITDYVPLHPNHGWPELIHRSNVYRDEGHMAKLMRALYAVEQLVEMPGPEIPIAKGDFVKIAHMAMDSAERAFGADGHRMPKAAAQSIEERIGLGGEMVTDNMKRYVFYGGLPQAWDFIPDQTSI